MDLLRYFMIAFFLGALAILGLPYALALSTNLPAKHPLKEGENLRTCTYCHEADESFPFARYNHGLLFGQKHGAPARSNSAVCLMCHDKKQCNTCHHQHAGLKPELKMHGDPRPQSPHRGDYLTRHRIDGRLNPARCLHCHKRPKTSKSCRACHKTD